MYFLFDIGRWECAWVRLKRFFNLTHYDGFKKSNLIYMDRVGLGWTYEMDIFLIIIIIK